jgi:hypothetical protein
MNQPCYLGGTTLYESLISALVLITLINHVFSIIHRRIGPGSMKQHGPDVAVARVRCTAMSGIYHRLTLNQIHIHIC